MSPPIRRLVLDVMKNGGRRQGATPTARPASTSRPNTPILAKQTQMSAPRTRSPSSWTIARSSVVMRRWAGRSGTRPSRSRDRRAGAFDRRQLALAGPAVGLRLRRRRSCVRRPARPDDRWDDNRDRPRGGRNGAAHDAGLHDVPDPSRCSPRRSMHFPSHRRRTQTDERWSSSGLTACSNAIVASVHRSRGTPSTAKRAADRNACGRSSDQSARCSDVPDRPDCSGFPADPDVTNRRYAPAFVISLFSAFRRCSS